MRAMTAEHIIRTIFEDTREPNLFEKAFAKVQGKTPERKHLSLNQALKTLQSQGLSPRAAEIAKRSFERTITEEIHSTLQNIKANGRPARYVHHQVRYSGTYYLGVKVVTPSFDLTQNQDGLRHLRHTCKEQLHKTIEKARYVFKNTKAQKMNGLVPTV